MNKAFVDTDVILDLLTQRTPHFHFAALLFTFAEMKKLTLYTSPSVFINAFYILRKHLGTVEAKKALMRLRLLIHVIDSDEKIIDLACLSDFSDLEDAIQYYTAQAHRLGTLITRNIKDYKVNDMIIQSPETYLASKGWI